MYEELQAYNRKVQAANEKPADFNYDEKIKSAKEHFERRVIEIVENSRQKNLPIEQ